MKNRCLCVCILLFAAGCKQYTAVDVSSIKQAASSANGTEPAKAIGDAIKAISGGGTSYEGDGLLIVRTTPCKTKKIRRLVESIRAQRGLPPTNWGPHWVPR